MSRDMTRRYYKKMTGTPCSTDALSLSQEELQAKEQEAEEYLSKVPEDQRANGIISVGAALGDDDYVQMYL